MLSLLFAPGSANIGEYSNIYFFLSGRTWVVLMKSLQTKKMERGLELFLQEASTGKLILMLN